MTNSIMRIQKLIRDNMGNFPGLKGLGREEMPKRVLSLVSAIITVTFFLTLGADYISKGGLMIGWLLKIWSRKKI